MSHMAIDTDHPHAASLAERATPHDVARTAYRRDPASIRAKVAATAMIQGVDVPTAQELSTFLALRSKFDEYFEMATQAWADHERQAGNPKFKHVTNKNCYPGELDRDNIECEYYPDARASRNYDTATLSIPLGDFFPDYGTIRDTLKALGAE